MKRWGAVALGGAVVALLGAVGAVGSTFVRSDLTVPSGAVAALPAHPEVEGVSVTVIPTARVATQHGFSVRGAPLTDPLVSAMVAVLVRHPEGPILIDAGMSRNGVAHVATVPLLMQAIIELELSQSVAEGLAGQGLAASDLRGVLLTHSHWDHVSGLEDLPGVPVWLTDEEQGYIAHDDGAALYRQLDAAEPVVVRRLSFDGGPYGPFPSHHDVYGDGSVVAVPMPGHSPGSVGVFVHLSDGRRLLFIGDTAWAEEGVTWPAEKPWLSRRMVDLDPARVREQLVALHRLAAVHPELVIVPAHDERVHARLADGG
mgnify:CR=1 FL=1